MSSFLERWSRNKRAAAEARASEPEAESNVQAEVESGQEPVEDDLIDEAVLKALPSLDEITAGTDIMPFLRRGVPRALKNAALRKMWLLDPRIRDHKDIAVDYAWDWNTPGGVPGNGGSIDPEDVAKLIRGLFSKPAAVPAHADAAAASEEEHAEPAAEEPPGGTALPPADPVPQPPVLEAAPAGQNAVAMARAGIADDGPGRNVVAPRKRHGGAMPE